MHKDFPYILIAEEKYGSRYFYVDSQETLDKVCLKLLKERIESEYYMERLKQPEEPEYTMGEARELKGAAKQAAINEIFMYQRNLKEANKQNEFVTEVEEAVKQNNGQLARDILFGVRNDYEHEHLTLEKPEDAEV